MQQSVKQRLIEYIKSKGLSQRRFESIVGLSNGYVNNISSGIGAAKLAEISRHFPDLSHSWLLTGEGPMLNSEKTMLPETQQLPLIPVDAMAGALTGSDYAFASYDCEMYVVPIFRGAEFLIRVQGDSMVPTYHSGDIVACRRVPLTHLWFQWGKTYVLDTRQGALLKRIEPSEHQGCISIHSENPQYRPFDLSIEEINGIAIVLGVIRVE